MKKLTFKKFKPNSKNGKLILSSFWGLSVCILMCFLGAFIFYICDLDFADAFVFSIMVYVISSFVCGYIAGRKLKENGILSGAAGGFLFFLMCLVISLFVDLKFTADIFYKLGICLTSGAIGGIAGVNKRNRKKIKPRKAG